MQEENTINFVVFLPKMHNLSLIMRKHKTTQIERLSCIIIGLLPSKVSRSSKLKY